MFRAGFDARRHRFTDEERRRGLRVREGMRRISGALREMLEQEETAEGVARAMIAACQKGDASMMRIVLDRTEGAVGAKVEVSDAAVFAAFGRALVARGVSEGEAEAVFALVASELEGSGGGAADDGGGSVG